MAPSFRSVLALLLLVPATLASPTHMLYGRAAGPIPPTQDPFYQPAAGYASKKPGTILKHRKVPFPIEFFPTVPVNYSAAYQIQYRTTNTLGKPQAAITTLVIPRNADASKHVSFQTAYDSAYVNCAPSYYLQKGHKNGSEADSALAILTFNYGYYMSFPDYEGPRAAFVSGLQAGRAVLDSVRAIQASGSFSGIKANANHALWGYSGGALASEWASELQPRYAPELKIKGAAIGGLTPNVTSVLFSIINTTNAALAPSAILGLSHAYPNLTEWLSKNLVKSKEAKFRIAESACLPDYSDQFSGEDIAMYFKNGYASLDEPVPATVRKWAGQMGLRSTPKIPLYVYKAIHDEVSPVADTDALVKKYCKAGASVQYKKNAKGLHFDEASAGAGPAVQWLRAILAGAPPVKGCNTTTVGLT